MLPRLVAQRTDGQRDGDRHAQLALDLGLEVVDGVAAEHRLVHLGDLGPEVVGEQRRDGLADDLGLEVADDALGAAVARGDPALPVVGQERVARRLGEGFQDGPPLAGQSGQFAGARRAHPSP